MKKLIVSMCIFICLLLTSGAVFATESIDLSETKIDNINSVAEVKEMFPQAVIDENAISKVQESYNKGILPESMSKDAVPTQIYTKKINSNEIYNLNVYDDGSICLDGIKTQYDVTNAARGFAYGDTTVSYNYFLWRFAFKAEFQWNTDTGVGQFTDSWITTAGYVVPVDVGHSNNYAYAKGNALDNGMPTMGILLYANLGSYGSITKGHTLGIPY